jgi:5-methylcytosine-specific restriction enzyme A
MPWASKTICCRPGCNLLVATPGFCQAHRSENYKVYNAERAGRNLQTDRWYHTSRWQRLRLSVITAEPLCRLCRAVGRVTPAVLVDHIKPVRFEGEFWDRGNLQPLCNACHEAKSQAEGSRSRHRVRNPREPAAADLLPPLGNSSTSLPSSAVPLRLASPGGLSDDPAPPPVAKARPKRP